MAKYHNILVVINPEQSRQIALERAVKIAELNEHASLTVLLTIYDFSYELTAMLSAQEREEMRSGVLAQRQEWLEQILTPYRQQGLKCHIQVSWHSRPFESIIQTTLEGRFDLVVKATHQHSMLQSFIFTPTDWHLLRKCPCPVLLVKNGRWQRQGNIIAAINCTSDENDQRRLNRRLTQEAISIAQLLDAKLYLVNSYPTTPVHVAIELPGFDPHGYNQAVRQHHETLLTQHANEFGIAANMTRIMQGLPEEVLPELAKKLNANLMIMGSAGRTGFAAALLGNTAEHVVDNLPCDILILKSDDYLCPLDDGTN